MASSYEEVIELLEGIHKSAFQKAMQEKKTLCEYFSLSDNDLEEWDLSYYMRKYKEV